VKVIRNFVAVGVLFATGAFASNLLSNGSFESASSGNVFDNGANPYHNGYGDALAVGSTTLANWSIITNGVSWLYTGDFGLTPQAGSYFLDLTGYVDGAIGGVSQGVTLASTGNYALTFWLGVNSSVTGDGGPVQLTASAGTAVGTTSSTFTSPSTGWTLETLDFSAAAGNVTISLVGTSVPTGGKYIGLDNVDLEYLGTSVPEPAMILPLALAGAFFVVSRRKRARQ
jgi:hypothetical protein